MMFGACRPLKPAFKPGFTFAGEVYLPTGIGPL